MDEVFVLQQAGQTDAAVAEVSLPAEFLLKPRAAGRYGRFRITRSLHVIVGESREAVLLSLGLAKAKAKEKKKQVGKRKAGEEKNRVAPVVML